MSTTFGVKIPSTGEIKEVAFRGNSGGIWWKKEICELLPDELEVIPMDNDAQGIYTIGDIKMKLKKS